MNSSCQVLGNGQANPSHPADNDLDSFFSETCPRRPDGKAGGLKSLNPSIRLPVVDANIRAAKRTFRDDVASRFTPILNLPVKIDVAAEYIRKFLLNDPDGTQQRRPRRFNNTLSRDGLQSVGDARDLDGAKVLVAPGLRKKQ
jgi:hypothetical protein